MLTIAAPAPISGTQALVSRNGPVRLTSIVRWNSASEVSSAGLNTATPALFTSASSVPKRALSLRHRGFDLIREPDVACERQRALWLA